MPRSNTEKKVDVCELIVHASRCMRTREVATLTPDKQATAKIENLGERPSTDWGKGPESLFQ